MKRVIKWTINGKKIYRVDKRTKGGSGERKCLIIGTVLKELYSSSRPVNG